MPDSGGFPTGASPGTKRERPMSTQQNFAADRHKVTADEVSLMLAANREGSTAMQANQTTGRLTRNCG